MERHFFSCTSINFEIIAKRVIIIKSITCLGVSLIYSNLDNVSQLINLKQYRIWVKS